MADTPKIPDRLARFVQPFYVDAFGSLPPAPVNALRSPPDPDWISMFAWRRCEPRRYSAKASTKR
jgi:hypothetical protein